MRHCGVEMEDFSWGHLCSVCGKKLVFRSKRNRKIVNPSPSEDEGVVRYRDDAQDRAKGRLRDKSGVKK